jgi:glycosyltransferase involved in cell wall biosynthesis
MKLLLVSHPPLAAESGAAQITLSLAEALRARGHEALAWSPEPLPPGTRWWNRWRAQRRALERFVAAAGPFDVIDAPAASIGPRLAGAAFLVARSFQPEHLYLADDLRAQFRRPSWRTPFHAAHGGIVGTAILRGWHRAALILCLGTLERDWMRRRFPRLSSRLAVYVVAPPPAERDAFAAVRRARSTPATPGNRFLWIGRWAAHKGTGRLVRFLKDRAATHPDDTFTLAGCGPAAERDLPAWLLRDGRVRIVPSFPRADLPALLAAHDSGLFTSSVEGWGLCLNEMLEAGLAVYATDAGGTADLKPYWPSHLRPFPPPARVEPFGPEPDLGSYTERFSWPAIARRYEEDLLARGGRAMSPGSGA